MRRLHTRRPKSKPRCGSDCSPQRAPVGAADNAPRSHHPHHTRCGRTRHLYHRLPATTVPRRYRPVTAIAVLAWNDAASAVVVLLTVPLMPIFGILIGWHTKAKTEQQWSRLHRLGGHFSRRRGRALDISRVRSRRQGRRRGARHRRPLPRRDHEHLEDCVPVGAGLGTHCSALGGAGRRSIGLQLLNGTMNLYTAFFVLLLVPEVYVPLRSMGSQFHAAAEGLAACRSAFALTDNSEDDHGPPQQATCFVGGEGTGGAETVGQPTPGSGTGPTVIHRRTATHRPISPTATADSTGGRPCPALKTTLDKPYVTSDTIQIGAEVGGPRTSRVTGSPFLTFDNVSVTYPGRSTRALTGLSAVVSVAAPWRWWAPAGPASRRC